MQNSTTQTVIFRYSFQKYSMYKKSKKYHPVSKKKKSGKQMKIENLHLKQLLMYVHWLKEKLSLQWMKTGNPSREIETTKRSQVAHFNLINTFSEVKNSLAMFKSRSEMI